MRDFKKIEILKKIRDTTYLVTSLHRTKKNIYPRPLVKVSKRRRKLGRKWLTFREIIPQLQFYVLWLEHLKIKVLHLSSALRSWTGKLIIHHLYMRESTSNVTKLMDNGTILATIYLVISSTGTKLTINEPHVNGPDKFMISVGKRTGY